MKKPIKSISPEVAALMSIARAMNRLAAAVEAMNAVEKELPSEQYQSIDDELKAS